jgi:hypothetical protein
MSYNTQLTSAQGYNINRIVYQQPLTATIPNSKPPLSYKRVNIGTKNPNNTTGDLIISTESVFSFGVSENINPETKAINGYVMALCLWNKDGATAAEKQWTDKFDEIVEHTKEYILKNQEDLTKQQIDAHDLKKFNPLYWKKDRNGIIPGTGPTLYCKLIVSKKDGNEKILSNFFDADSGDDLDPLQLLGKYCHVRAAVKIESIFVGNKISLQIKLWEAEVRLIEKGMRRLLRPSNKVVIDYDDDYEGEEDDVDEMGETPKSDAGSVVNSDNEDLAQLPSPPRKKITRKKVATK